MISFSEFALSMAAGGLTTLSPCVLPLLPLVVGGATQKNKLAPVFMGTGMVASFTLIGVVLGVLGERLSLNPDTVRTVGAWCLVLLGIVMLVPALTTRFNAMMSPLASRANQGAAGIDGASNLGALTLGALLGLVWSPCSGPLLASAITLVASEGGAIRGALILGLFGLGAAIPLVGLAYASRHGFARVRGWASGRVAFLKQAFAVVVILAGVAILTGADKWLETTILNLLPDAWLRLTVLF